MRSPSSKSTAAPSVTVEEAQAAFGEIAQELEEIRSRISRSLTACCRWEQAAG